MSKSRRRQNTIRIEMRDPYFVIHVGYARCMLITNYLRNDRCIFIVTHHASKAAIYSGV